MKRTARFFACLGVLLLVAAGGLCRVHAEGPDERRIPLSSNLWHAAQHKGRKVELPSIEGRMVLAGNARTYRLFVPVLSPAEHAKGLVLVFHGGSGTAEGAERTYGMNKIAGGQGFAVTYPQGLNKHWNVGRPKANPGVDDLAFVSALIDKLTSELQIDRNKVYACGISNGGIFSNHLALHLSNKISAIASVAGAIAVPDANVKPGRPVSVILIHGTDDAFVPINGGELTHTPVGGAVLSHVDTFNTWIKLDGGAVGAPVKDKTLCTDGAMRGFMHVNLNTPLVSTTTLTKSGAICESVVIEKGGHTWPGRVMKPLLGIDGVTATNLDATNLICDFFNRAGRTSRARSLDK